MICLLCQKGALAGIKRPQSKGETLLSWIISYLSHGPLFRRLENRVQSDKIRPLGLHKWAETSACTCTHSCGARWKPRDDSGFQRSVPFHPISLSLSLPPFLLNGFSFPRPAAWVLLSICQGDDFLPKTLPLVIMAWDKLCRNSWSWRPT